MSMSCHVNSWVFFGSGFLYDYVSTGPVGSGFSSVFHREDPRQEHEEWVQQREQDAQRPAVWEIFLGAVSRVTYEACEFANHHGDLIDLFNWVVATQIFFIFTPIWGR